MPDGFDRAVSLLPELLRSAVYRQPQNLRESAEEIRLRQGQLPSLLLPEGEQVFFPDRPVSAGDLSRVLEKASQASLHAVRDELRRGYVSARGGVRVGVCGCAVMNETLEALRDFSSLSIRIPRQIRGVGGSILPSLSGGDKSVLIVSPPGGGKTTFLRELVRVSSNGGRRIALADERCEVAAVCQGEPGFDVGVCTDILSGAPKAEGAMMLLRAMNPQIIALDEITAGADVDAIEQIANCGVKLFATAHADSIAQLEKRPLYRKMLSLEVFDRVVVISGRGERKYQVMAL